jgi:hypothetical protein
MGDEEQVTEEEAAAEEESEAPAPKAIDTGALLAEAERRVAKIEARGKDPGVTYAGFVVDLLDNSTEAIDTALRAEAAARLEGPLKGSSDIYRKHSLAGKVQAGQFDA